MADELLKEKNFVSIVLSFQNDEAVIGTFLQTVDAFLAGKFSAYEYIVVNNGSGDASGPIIRDIAGKLSGSVTMLNLSYVHDRESAMFAGINLAIGDYIFEFDSLNISYEPEIIWRAYGKCLEGYDVVSTSPNKPIQMSSKIFYYYLSAITHNKMKLTTETFRIVSRRALNRILRSTGKMLYRKAMYNCSGFDVFNLKYEPLNKSDIGADIALSDKVRSGLDILVSFSEVGLSVAANICFVFSFILLFVIGYTFFSYFTKPDIQPGWTTMMLLVSTGFFGVFFVLTIMSKYLTSLLYELQDRPRYTYRSIEKLSE